MKQQTFVPETKTDTHSKNVLHYKESRGAQGKPYQYMPKNYSTKQYPLPADITEQNRLADECLEFVAKNKPTNIKDFALSRGYSPYKFKHLADNNPYFSEVYDLALAMVGRKMEDEWRYFQCKDSFAKDYLPQYDQDYAAYRLQQIKMVTDKINSKNFQYVSFSHDMTPQIGKSNEPNLLEVQSEKVPNRPDQSDKD